MGGTVENLTHKLAIQTMPDMNFASQSLIDSLTDRLLHEVTPKPNGIFVTSDVIVPTIYRALERNGVRPGKDIEIVSCNNEKSYLLPLHPMPAEIDIQADLIGQEAVERLLWRIDHPRATRVSLVLEPRLVTSQEADHRI
jgi:DNA-binding LacI/PurR family transcriptional regulator